MTPSLIELAEAFEKLTRIEEYLIATTYESNYDSAAWANVRDSLAILFECEEKIRQQIIKRIAAHNPTL